MNEKSAAEVMLRDVLFAHWPIAAEKLRSVVPDPLSIDTFDGSAWITVLVVDIAGARVRGVPYHPSLPSINLRTYVSYDGEPGQFAGFRRALSQRTQNVESPVTSRDVLDQFAGVHWDVFCCERS